MCEVWCFFVRKRNETPSHNETEWSANDFQWLFHFLFFDETATHNLHKLHWLAARFFSSEGVRRWTPSRFWCGVRFRFRFHLVRQRIYPCTCLCNFTLSRITNVQTDTGGGELLIWASCFSCPKMLISLCDGQTLCRLRGVGLIRWASCYLCPVEIFLWWLGLVHTHRSEEWVADGNK